VSGEPASPIPQTPSLRASASAMVPLPYPLPPLLTVALCSIVDVYLHPAGEPVAVLFRLPSPLLTSLIFLSLV